MNRNGIFRRFFILFLPIFVFIICFSGIPQASGKKNSVKRPADKANFKLNFFPSLQKKLAGDGFDKRNLYRVFGAKGVFFDEKGVSRYFLHREGRANYKQFTKPDLIKKTKSYLKKYKKEFNTAEKQLGVDQHVIAAILLVETQLGRYLGKSSVINSLSTMASLSDSEARKYLWKGVSKKSHLSKKAFQKKAAKKADWAYSELKAFLKYTSGMKKNPVKIQGSFAGAIGICQFMPSNILKFGKDGNGDRAIDLFDHSDAIMSTANYLKKFGWKPKMKKKEAFRVVYAYNHSRYYVRTILRISELLKDRS